MLTSEEDKKEKVEVVASSTDSETAESLQTKSESRRQSFSNGEKKPIEQSRKPSMGAATKKASISGSIVSSVMKPFIDAAAAAIAPPANAKIHPGGDSKTTDKKSVRRSSGSQRDESSARRRPSMAPASKQPSVIAVIQEEEKDYGDAKPPEAAPTEAAKESCMVIDENTLECKICKLPPFTSRALLEKHVKFSQVHASTLSKLGGSISAFQGTKSRNLNDTGANKQKTLWKMAISRVLVLNFQKRIMQQVVRLDLGVKHLKSKAYFQGHKNMWRTQDNITYDMYLHETQPAPPVEGDEQPKAPIYFVRPIAIIELIGYDDKTQTELPRLYFDHLKVTELVKNEIDVELKKLNTLVDAAGTRVTKKFTSELLFSQITPEISVDEATKVKMFSTKILSSPEKDVSSTIMSYDHPFIKFALKPAVVSRHKRSTQAEIDAKMGELQKSLSSIGTASRQAEERSIRVG